MDLYDVAIIGGGLAGLSASIDLARRGHKVFLAEKEAYPHHKVCGEYISNEILPYLHSIGIKLDLAVPINRVQISDLKGMVAESKLPLGGFGYSRYGLDNLMYKSALKANTEIFIGAAKNVSFLKTHFEIKLSNKRIVKSLVVIGAYGKRSNLDKELKRKFINKKAPWLGVKSHYSFPDYPDDLVGIHSFEGGYGGLSKVETGSINFCYLASYKSFQKYKSIPKYNAKVVSKNPILKSFLENAKPVMNQPLSIAQISFADKMAVEQHMLMCGDTAGLIHPLCGNGMAMAIHSAKIASDLIDTFLTNPAYSRVQLEKDYQLEWNSTFSTRLKAGQFLQSLFVKPYISSFALKIVKASPLLLNSIIKQTHGKPIRL
ncbi:NAD(P)/FAD-dependent oxidoreductase [Eudoraea chungangensis]|uniref:NAD(P)/FAD-dependent oxidoreductase n=1 Tax=Eudoraea chungangensis TaxID=1481905 RepID=UPI0023EAB988|nr:NAD(P)/FAD-dependent oxidoreductase [Eudoraea chungangensis]